MDNEKTVSKDEILFYMDSGCTDHLVNKKEYFVDLMILENPVKIAIAKIDSFIEAVGIGNIEALSYVGGNKISCKIKNVFYVPSLRKNLLSVKRLEMSDINVVFADGGVKLLRDGNLIGEGTRNNLYEIKFVVANKECLNVETKNDCVNL